MTRLAISFCATILLILGCGLHQAFAQIPYARPRQSDETLVRRSQAAEETYHEVEELLAEAQRAHLGPNDPHVASLSRALLSARDYLVATERALQDFRIATILEPPPPPVLDCPMPVETRDSSGDHESVLGPESGERAEPARDYVCHNRLFPPEPAVVLPNQRLHLSGAVVLKEAVQLWTRTLVARR
jgi:hypothetical protein